MDLLSCFFGDILTSLMLVKFPYYSPFQHINERVTCDHNVLFSDILAQKITKMFNFIMTVQLLILVLI